MSALWLRRTRRGWARKLAAIPAMATEPIDSVRSLTMRFHNLLENTIAMHGFQLAEDGFYRRKAARIRAEMLDIHHLRRTTRLIKAVINLLYEDGVCAQKVQALRDLSAQWSVRASHIRSRILWSTQLGFKRWTQHRGAARRALFSQMQLASNEAAHNF
jgi:hypothetical protein